MDITNKSVLVTGAHRGIGQALVDEALLRGAARVYAGTRHPLSHPDRRVTPLILDVTDAEQVQAAVARVEALDVVINNAGLALYEDLSDPIALEQSLAVNLYGPYRVTQAFLPMLLQSRGAIVNIGSIAAWAAIPVTPAYSVSKAAAFALSQGMRALLAGRGVSVHVAMLGPVDTDMIRDLPIPKTPPEIVARGIFAGIEAGEEEIFPDLMSASMSEGWRNGPASARASERRAGRGVAAPADAPPRVSGPHGGVRR